VIGAGVQRSAMTRHLPTIAAAAALLLAGCGTGAPQRSADAAATARSDADMLHFARCMRAHGVLMQDPFNRPGHSGLSLDLPEKSPATTTAYGACGHFLASTIAIKLAHAPTIPAATRLGLIRYAECMRTRGVPMLDPDQNGSLNLGNVPGMGAGSGRYTPQFHQADANCRHLLPASVHDDGSGP
jgi:hypothetical protein